MMQMMLLNFFAGELTIFDIMPMCTSRAAA